MDSGLSRTNATLLGRLKDPQDQQAWAQFVDRYGPKIYGWCRRWRLQEADAEDVTQSVLLKLAEKMRSFAYNPAAGRFRGWLKTVTRHVWSDFLQSRRRGGTGSGDSQVVEQLAAIEARDDLLAQLEEEFDRELFEAAMDTVRKRVAPHTWEAFRLTALEGASGADAARQLDMKVATVFVAKSKVQKMLQQEVRALEDGNPG